jgi:hypothetical protein
MRRFSNILSFLAVALFLLCAGSVTKANGTDPQVGLGGGGTCPGTTTFSENSFTQAFTGLQTGCINDFQNNINDGTVTLDRLVVNITSAFSGQITCALLAGAPLNSTTPNGSSATSCTFFDATLLFSIAPGQIYGLTFDTHFGPTVDIVLAQTVVPEPATLLLLGTGLAALAANRKRLKAAKHLV